MEIIDADGLRNADWMSKLERNSMVQVAGEGDRWSRWKTEPHKDWENPKWHREVRIACQPGDTMRSSSGWCE